MDDTYMTTQQVVDAINHERARLMSAICLLEETAPSAAVTDEGWTTKDVLAHLIHWATQSAFGLGAQVDPPVYMLEERRRRQQAGLSDQMPGGAESNALAVAHYSSLPFDTVRAKFDDLVDALVARARFRTDDEMNTVGAIPWAGPRSLWQQIGGDTFLHWPLHSEAIEQAAARKPHCFT